MLKTSFPYIANKGSKVLILGTMPGEKSLALNQYYGHGGNQFWKVLFKLFNEPFTKDYKVKTDLLLKQNIALWDVLKNCQREGSADSTIKDEYPNDFETFFNDHPNITTVFFNGKKAKELYFKYFDVKPPKGFHICPSTSPANARFTFEEKLMNWKIVRDVLIEK